MSERISKKTLKHSFYKLLHEDFDNLFIQDPLAIRLLNALYAQGINNTSKLMDLTKRELQAIPLIGRAGIRSIERARQAVQSGNINHD